MGYLLWTVIGFAFACVSAENQRIVGGQNAPAQYPYLISLQICRTQTVPILGIPLPTFSGEPVRNWVHNCGGSIVTHRHVVTAAHCLKGHSAAGLSVWAGTTKLNGADGKRLMVESFIIHPNYVELNSSDIGIVTTVTPFVFGKKIAPISYAAKETPGNVDCVLTGWGYTMIFRVGEPPNDLQRITLTTMTNAQCREKQKVDRTGICTLAKFGRGACGGDSGGPLAKGNLLVGIVSYGTSMCAIGYPDVYTRVSVFYEWIKSNTHTESSSAPCMRARHQRCRR